MSQEKITIISAPSPHYTNKTIQPKYIVLHCIGYNDPLQILEKNGVSCHYLIPQQTSTRELTVYEVVKPPLRAWHAGVSQWGDDVGLNDFALGIEINMPDYARALENKTLDFLFFQPYQTPQITALKILVKELQHTYQIPPENVIGHSDISAWRNNSGLIELGKTDPGPTLPWKELAKEGIGIWPQKNCPEEIMKDLTPAHAQKLLRNVGYKVPFTEEFDDATNLTIGAARLHWDSDCFNSNTSTAQNCYNKPFDAQLGCALYNLDHKSSQNSNSQLFSGLAIAAATGGVLLLLVLVILLYKRLSHSQRNNYESIDDAALEPSNTSRRSFC